MKKDNENTALASYKDQYVSLSNQIARSKERVSLIEARIELLAIYNLRKSYKIRTKSDSDGNFINVKYVDIPAKEIKSLMGRKDSDVYTDIFNAARALEEKLYIIESRDTNQFMMTHLYDTVIYDKGVLSVGFNPELESHFLGLSDHFSTLSLEVCFSFKKCSALMLYRLLKSYAYKLPSIDKSLSQDQLPSIKLEYSLSELRLNLGFVDISQPAIKKEAYKKHPNWDKVSDLDKTPKYARFSDFEARVLTPAKEEINAISDIYIADIIKSTSGRGGKITAVTIVLQWNASYHGCSEPKKPTSDKEINEFCDMVMDLVPFKLRISDAQSISSAADYDIEKVKKAVDAFNSTKTDVDNAVGWIISAIKGNWEHKGKKTANKFNDFEQNQYDYDDLEKKLVAN